MEQLSTMKNTPPSQDHTPPASVLSRVLTEADDARTSTLESLVFGPGRFARTAYRIREGRSPISGFCHGAFLGETLIASVRLTPVLVGGQGPHVLLGPLTVHPNFSGQGHGRHLVTQALSAAKAAGIGAAILVGDRPYYERFGFKPVPMGRITFPGPVNPARILAADLRDGAASSLNGALTVAL
jgi:predicted N-acetyltransferase YhbS